MDTRNPQLQQIMHELETYQRDSKVPGGRPPGTEFKTLVRAGRDPARLGTGRRQGASGGRGCTIRRLCESSGTTG